MSQKITPLNNKIEQTLLVEPKEIPILEQQKVGNIQAKKEETKISRFDLNSVTLKAKSKSE